MTSPTPAAAPHSWTLWTRPTRRAKWRRVATGTRAELLRLMDAQPNGRTSEWILLEGGRKP